MELQLSKLPCAEDLKLIFIWVQDLIMQRKEEVEEQRQQDHATVGQRGVNFDESETI